MNLLFSSCFNLITNLSKKQLKINAIGSYLSCFLSTIEELIKGIIIVLMVSVIMSGLEDASQISPAQALHTELVRPQGSNSRWKESHDYMDPDNIRRIRNMEQIKDTRSIEDKRSLLNIEEIRSLEETWRMNNREEMKNIEDAKSLRNMEPDTRDTEDLKGSRLRLDTGDSQITEYFFMKGSCVGSSLTTVRPQSSIMDKIE